MSETKETTKTLTGQLLKAQKDMKPVTKDGKSHHGTYATLTSLFEMAMPILHKHDILVLQPVINDTECGLMIRTMLIHDGEQMSYEMPLIVPRQDPQGLGTAITYGRRYALGSILGVVTEDDDDGNRAVASIQSEGVYKASSNKPASDKQKYMITKLLQEKHNVEKDDIPTYINSEFKVQPNSMSSADASDIISSLKGE